MKSLFAVLCALGLMVSFSVKAADVGIAVVDIGKILQESPKVEKINDRLEEKFAKRQETIIEIQQALQKLSEEYERDVAVLGDEDREALEGKIIAKQQELQSKGQAYQQDIGEAQNKEMGDFFIEVQEAIDEYAQQEKLQLVIQDEVVLYMKEDLDITDIILKKIA